MSATTRTLVAASFDHPSSAMRISVSVAPNSSNYNHVTGAIAAFRASAPGGTTLRVDFAAKRVSGVGWLGITRLWGGGQENVRLTTTWKNYVAFLRVAYDTLITTAADGDSNVVANGNPDSFPNPWYGQKPTAAGLASATSAGAFSIVAGDVVRPPPLVDGVVLIDDVDVRFGPDALLDSADSPPLAVCGDSRVSGSEVREPSSSSACRPDCSGYSGEILCGNGLGADRDELIYCADTTDCGPQKLLGYA